MTFDCQDELEKIAAEAPHARLVLRIRADDAAAIVQFGHKYGADPDTQAPDLLRMAQHLGMTVVGVSFHIGSGSQTPGAHSAAVAAAKRVFNAADALGMPPLHLLDVGGGFWGRFDACGNVQLDGVAKSINAALEDYFPAGSGVRVIAEPGRYYAEACATMFAQVRTLLRAARLCSCHQLSRLLLAPSADSSAAHRM